MTENPTCPKCGAAFGVEWPTFHVTALPSAAMTTAEMATYAYDQIDQARAELNTVAK